MKKLSIDTETSKITLFYAAVLAGLYLISRANYLLFHSIAEMFGVIIAGGIFILAWNSRKIVANSYLLFLGIAYLFIACLDLIHTLSYAGMGIFKGFGANLPTQLWIATRYLESISLIIAPLVLKKKLNTRLIFFCYSMAVFILLGSIFHLKVFPDCFIEGTGLTTFKKTSEYIISGILLISVLLLFQRKHLFDTTVFRLLISSIIVTIASELAFTFYIHAYGFSNLMGHYFKIISFYLVYKAIIETGLMKPYNLLFRELKDNEAALKFSENNYRTLINNALVGIYRWRLDGTILFSNRAMATILEYSSPEEMQNINVSSIYKRPGDRELLIQEFKKQDTVESFEFEAVTKNGNTRHLLINASLKNNILSGMALDISDRKNVEQELQESLKKSKQHQAELSAMLELLEDSNERFRSVAESAYDAIMTADENSRIVFWNRGAELIFGYTAKEIIGSPIGVIIPESFHIPHLKSFDNAIAHHDIPLKNEISELIGLKKDGSEFPIELSIAKWKTKDNIFLTGIIRDITERKKNEDELKKHKEHLMELVEERTLELQKSNEKLSREILDRRHAEEQVRLMALFAQLNPSPVLRFDITGRVTMANSSAINILNISPDRETQITSLFPDLKEQDLVQCIHSSSISSHTVQIKKRFFYFTLIGISDRNIGQLYGSDITEQKKAEAESMRSSHLASIGELAAGVAHEINNPINGIINYTQILINRLELENREYDIAKRIINEGDRIAVIIRSLLSFASNTKEEKKPVSIQEIISDSLSLTATFLRKDGIRLKINIPGDLPEIMVQKQQIKQVCLNIMSNSRYALNKKYPFQNENKVIEITAKETTVDNSDYIDIIYYDTGDGIPENIADKIMNPFFTTKPVGIGTGLGLSISHGIIKDHNGRIILNSVEGKFTEAVIRLPAGNERAHSE